MVVNTNNTATSVELQLPPLDLLSRMAPLACVQMLFFAFASGEVTKLQSNWEELSRGWALWLVALTGVGSFSLNLCSLQANKVTSPLTLSIMANVKQVGALVDGYNWNDSFCSHRFRPLSCIHWAIGISCRGCWFSIGSILFSRAIGR